MIILRLVSRCGRRLAATLTALWSTAAAAVVVGAAPLPDSTWVGLASLPGQGRAAVFALAVDPTDDQAVLASNSQGSLLRSTNGGAGWTVVHAGKSPVNAIAFDPNSPRVVLAGTRGGGGLMSRDGGATWSSAGGLEGRSVHAFAFALDSMYAGTDTGVYASADGSKWTASGAAGHSISAIAVEAIHPPVRVVAGSDAQTGARGLVLFQTLDGGTTWTQLATTITGTMIVSMAAGPLPPTGNVRPLLVGTNTGLFASGDNGSTFAPISGGGLLPTTDYTDLAFVTTHFDRFYAASDGGGSASGGVWRTTDGAATFTSLRPPELAVTALAVSDDEQPVLYVATFDPSTHTPSLWAFHDTGGPPVGPVRSPRPVGSGASPERPPDTSSLSQLLSSPELPYLGLGLGALAVVLTAIAAHLRGRQR